MCVPKKWDFGELGKVKNQTGNATICGRLLRTTRYLQLSLSLRPFWPGGKGIDFMWFR